MHTVTRYHDFCAGHTVTGHESKCKHIHGHNYRVYFHVRALPPQVMGKLPGTVSELDEVGRVVDFSVVKSTLCQWLEDNWDHKFLIYRHDPRRNQLVATDVDSLVICDFNPTAENMAQHLVEQVAPEMLESLGLELVEVELWETRKCAVTYKKGNRA